jgi:hypothetical protein
MCEGKAYGLRAVRLIFLDVGPTLVPLNAYPRGVAYTGFDADGPATVS